jgi:type II secretory pathway pseudopilin PulG
MRKKRSITLLEIMIVIMLIGLIGGVVSYNLKGTLDKGKAFRTEQGMKKLEDILNMEIQTGSASLQDLIGRTDSKEEQIAACVEKSGLISAKEVKKFIRDGWGHPYVIKKVKGNLEVVVSSPKFEEYQKAHGIVSDNPSLAETEE